MQFSTTLAVLATFASTALAAAMPAVEARTILYCGTQPYDPNGYTCFPRNNNALCPISNGVKYQPCGNRPNHACYDPGNYGCRNNRELYLITTCNGVPFDYNSYTCVDGKYLCPKSAPLRCGDACYDIDYYWCDNGVLKQQGQS